MQSQAFRIPFLLCFCLLLLKGTCLKAQDFLWARSAGGTDIDYAIGMAVDQAGYSYVAGQIRGTASFVNNSTGVATTLVSKGGNDIFVAKYDPEGNLVWATQGGGTGDDDARGMTIDKQGNCYVTGSFRGSATFGTTTITANGAADMLLLKLDTDGNFVWVKNAATGADDQGGYGIFVDDAGESYIAGQTKDNATLGTVQVISKGGLDSFIAKFDHAGNIKWARGAGGTGIDYARGIVVDAQGNSYLTGAFQNTANFEGTLLPGAGGYDVFLAKYSSDGQLVWAKRAGGSGEDIGRSIALDAGGNIYCTGGFENSAIFDGTALVSGGSTDIYMARYNSSGQLTWLRKAGGTGSEYGYSIALDPAGNSFVSGFYSSAAASFGCSSMVNNGLTDIYVAKYDPAGSVLWTKSAGSTSNDAAFGLGIDGSGNAYITGQISGPVNFGLQTLTSKGDRDIFVAKIFSVPASIALAGLAPLCSGSTGTVSFSVSCAVPAGETYTVQLSDPNSGQFPVTPRVIGSGSTSPLSIALPAQLVPGNYRVRVVSGGAVVSNAELLTVQPTASAVTLSAGNVDACGGSALTFSATPQNGGTTPRYEWTINGVSQGITTADAIQVPLPGSGSAYDLVVGVTMTSSLPCTVPVSGQQTIRVDKSPAIALQQPANPYCPSSAFTLNFTPSCLPAGERYTAEVSALNGQPLVPVVVIPGISLSSPLQGQLPAQLGAGTYSVRVVSSAGVYSNPADLVVAVGESPALAIEVDRSMECSGGTLVLKALCAGAGTNALFQWKINGKNYGPPGSGPEVNLTGLSSLEKDSAVQVSVQMIPADYCTPPVTARADVVLHPLPRILCRLPERVTISEESLFEVSVRNGRPPFRFDWDFGNGQSQSVPDDSIHYTYSSEGTYRIGVKVTDARGCQTYCEREVEVIAPVNSPPNVFTPNGDKRNERFTIDYRGKEKFEMYIFNRWGKSLATIYDGINGWDGNGCSSGVYYYRIKVAGREFKGWVTLLR